MNLTDTLNIFSDASVKYNSACYGAVAVYGDKVIDEYYRINSDTTVPAAEIRGLRCSLHLALRYRNDFPVINIFSDSLYTVNAIRDYSNRWRWDYIKETYVYPSGTVIANQELLYECLSLLWELQRTNTVFIYHQKGHVVCKEKGLQKADKSFKKHNKLDQKVGIDSIRYISCYNNYVDEHTRSLLYRADTRNNNYIDPIRFIAPAYDFIYQNVQ